MSGFPSCYTPWGYVALGSILILERPVSPLDLTIDGMSCGHCLNTVRGTLDRLPGVSVETVTMGRAKLAFDPDAATLPQILSALAAEGYTAHPTLP